MKKINFKRNEEFRRLWTNDEYYDIVDKLKDYGCMYIKGREEYILLKEEVILTEDKNSGKKENDENNDNSRDNQTSVIPEYGKPVVGNDTSINEKGSQVFLKALDKQKSQSIVDEIPSFRVLQSDILNINIGFDTEFQNYIDANGNDHRRVLSLQMSIVIGDSIVRYLFLVNPRYQEVTNEGGMIPVKYCLADILSDIKDNYCPSIPLIHKKDIEYTEREWKGHAPYKVVNYKAMKDVIIPVTLICHTAKADISVFRRSKYDVDILRKLGEIQGGWMTTDNLRIKAEKDKSYNYYWLIDVNVRDTLGLTPAEHKSLKALGNIINIPKIELDEGIIERMAMYARTNPIGYYEYAMNDADIVVLFCSELFLRNRNIPITLSSAAARAMKNSIMGYFGVKSTALYDRVYRGLEILDEGLITDKDKMKFLRATRYVPILDNPDARLMHEYFEEAYVGGFNASFYIGWITEYTTDFDLKNAYPTAMANVIDIDWDKPVTDLKKDSYITYDDLVSPLTPSVAVCDYEFPDDCYCPNIPTTVNGMRIYPKKGKNVYMSGPDMWLALKLGAKIKVHRGFRCSVLLENAQHSKCLSYAVSNLVQDRAKAKKIYKDNLLIEKALKTMVCSCYGKTAQNVDPKTRYNAKIMGRVDSEPSLVTSPYHACYTTALVRCMLIACINQLHDMGYHVYSVTTDGFITDAPEEEVKGIDAYGFTDIFREGRFTLNQNREDNDDNQVWEAKHYNNTFLNITTRGNVAVNDGGVLAHNSYTTGEVKDSRADRDAYIIAVLAREGRLECKTDVWTRFSEIVERKHDFCVTETIRNLSMDFDYKREPIVETAKDTPVHYESADGKYSVDTVIAEFDTRPYEDVEAFMNYRQTKKNEKCIKVKKDIERVKVKSTTDYKGYIGKDLDRKVLLSILMGYRQGIYKIPALEGLKQAEIVEKVNSWGISTISVNDWKNCSRTKRQANMLPYELVEKMLNKIIELG